MRVIAKAYMDEPLDREVVGQGPRVTYIAKLSTDVPQSNPLTEGVGFPKDCVFEFEPELFSDLRNAWEGSDGDALTRHWRRARRLNV